MAGGVLLYFHGCGVLSFMDFIFSLINLKLKILLNNNERKWAGI
jgi:hypothetical protein